MKDCRIGENCSLGQNVFVASGVVVGNNVKIQNNVSLYTGVRLEDDVFCGPSCVFTNVVNPRSEVVRREEFRETVLRKGATVGANATIVCGHTIGRYAFVGAGAVVRDDIPDYALVVGVPAVRKGWMSRHGYRLSEPDGEGIMLCPQTSWRYHEISPGTVVCLDWSEKKVCPIMPEPNSKAGRSTPRQVLIVSYAFPPMNVPGSIRVAKFAKYLPEFGWEPIVLTVEDGYSGRPLDHGSFEQVASRVLRAREFDPVKTLAGSGRKTPQNVKSSHSGGVRDRLQRWYSSLVFPDRDWLWRRPAVRKAQEFLAGCRNGPAAIYSSSPCITNHRVAMQLKQLTGLPWVADFRDFWAFSKSRKPPAWRRKLERRLELRICSQCDALVTISDHYRRKFEDEHGTQSTFAIHNGFDPADFPEIDSGAGFPFFSITHAGSFYSGQRDPEPLFRVIARLARRGEIDLSRVTLDFFGPQEEVIKGMIQRHGLRNNSRWHGLLSYEDLIPRLLQSFLLLVVTHKADDTLTSKIFDYMGCRRPILALTQPGGSLASIMETQQLGMVVGPAEEDRLEAWIRDQWSLWEKGSRSWRGVKGNDLQEYTRPFQAGQLAEILDSLIPTGADV